MEYQSNALISVGSYATATSAPKVDDTLINRLKGIQSTVHSALDGSRHVARKLYGSEPETGNSQVQPAPETVDELTRTIDILTRQLEEHLRKTGERL